MRSRNKLVVLIATVIALAALTRPTWLPLFDVDSPPSFDNSEDEVAIVYPSTERSSVLISLNIYTANSQPGVDNSDSYRADLLIEPIVRDYSGDQIVYSNEPYIVAVHGQTTDWLSSCHAPSAPQLGSIQPTIVQSKDMPASLGFDTGIWADGTGIYYKFTEAVQCDLASSKIWGKNGSDHDFAVPQFTLKTEKAASFSERRRASSCLSTILYSAPFQAISFSDPPGSSEDDSQAFGISRQWSECDNNPDPAYDTSDISSSSIVGRITDSNETVQNSKNLFFAGVFAGIIGGLFIEILNTSFEVTPLSSRRRVRRRRVRPEKVEKTTVNEDLDMPNLGEFFD